MNRKLSFFIAAFTMTSIILFGQKTFTINNSSKIYNAKIQVEKCEDKTCSGSGTIKIYTKNNSRLLQEFKSEDLYFTLDHNNKPSTVMELYDEQSPLIFGDFNFDQNEDLAIINGNNSGYGLSSYDVYVYNVTRKQFVLSKELTELASTNLGMFDIDKKRKRLKTFTKSGCCWHQSTEYEVVPKKGLVRVYELTEDATKGDDYVYVTEEKFINGKWTKTTKKHRTKDYYKD